MLISCVPQHHHCHGNLWAGKCPWPTSTGVSQALSKVTRENMLPSENHFLGSSHKNTPRWWRPGIKGFCLGSVLREVSHFFPSVHCRVLKCSRAVLTTSPLPRCQAVGNTEVNRGAPSPFLSTATTVPACLPPSFPTCLPPSLRPVQGRSVTLFSQGEDTEAA